MMCESCGNAWRLTAQKLGERLGQVTAGDDVERVHQAFEEASGRGGPRKFQWRVWTTAQGERIPFNALTTAHVKNIIALGEAIINGKKPRSLWTSLEVLKSRWITTVNEMNEILAHRG